MLNNSISTLRLQYYSIFRETQYCHFENVFLPNVCCTFFFKATVTNAELNCSVLCFTLQLIIVWTQLCSIAAGQRKCGSSVPSVCSGFVTRHSVTNPLHPFQKIQSPAGFFEKDEEKRKGKPALEMASSLSAGADDSAVWWLQAILSEDDNYHPESLSLKLFFFFNFEYRLYLSLHFQHLNT